MDTGTKIKELRQEKGYTQIKLAKLAGLTPAAISQYESGSRRPNVEALKKIADVFAVSLNHLIDGEIKSDDAESEKQEVWFRKYSTLSEKDKEIIDNYLNYLSKKDYK